ncbi:hypothetical protein [Nocardia jejuensis]|uniref:hypothetical protein n=1 Tax=Nocardia jejuensis TaxID=328049 RepID=UPI000831C56D|nr:hypothetical protein [Nocardia jejuensis]
MPTAQCPHKSTMQFRTGYDLTTRARSYYTQCTNVACLAHLGFGLETMDHYSVHYRSAWGYDTRCFGTLAAAEADRLTHRPWNNTESHIGLCDCPEGIAARPIRVGDAVAFRDPIPPAHITHLSNEILSHVIAIEPDMHDSLIVALTYAHPSTARLNAHDLMPILRPTP